MKEISRFSFENRLDIESILKQENIAFESKPVQTGVSKSGGHHEYCFYVEEENFSKTVHLIREYYGLFKKEETPYSGNCPACSTAVNEKTECPECGLCFNPDPYFSFQNHPFYNFLIENKLL